MENQHGAPRELQRNMRESLPSRDFQLNEEVEHFNTASWGLVAAHRSSDKCMMWSLPWSPCSLRCPVSFSARHEELIGNGHGQHSSWPVAPFSLSGYRPFPLFHPDCRLLIKIKMERKLLTYWVKMLSTFEHECWHWRFPIQPTEIPLACHTWVTWVLEFQPRLTHIHKFAGVMKLSESTVFLLFVPNMFCPEPTPPNLFPPRV